MKVRLAFVPNSSSSSYLIDLPQGFDPLKHFQDFTYENASKEFMEALKQLLKNGYIDSYETEEWDDLYDALHKYEVGYIAHGPDEPSTIILVDITRRLQR